MEVCPTDAIIRTEFDTVYIQPDVCNGCRDCIAACPYGVIEMDETEERRAEVHALLRPAAGRPGAGLRQGLPDPVDPVRTGRASCASGRSSAWTTLHAQGVTEAQLYGADESVYGGLNAFFLLMDKPETYGLPNAENAVLPSRNNARGYLATLVTARAGGARRPDRAAPAQGADAGAGRDGPTGRATRPSR